MAKGAWLLSGANEPFIHLYAKACKNHENSDHGIVLDIQANEFNATFAINMRQIECGFLDALAGLDRLWYC